MSQNEEQTERPFQSPYEVRDPHITLEGDMVLAPETRRMFDEAIGAMRYHKIIYSDWGLGAVDPTGRNMVLNFYGPPGTGKTLAAEALAGTLQCPFIHIGISEVESKFVGETAKNISAAFKAAAITGALLFFDEADTLLGARLSSVTQGIDNEINAMRSTLLIELERFEGIVVFATNFSNNYDNAFVSRIRYHIKFELPDLDGRRRLWQRLMVPGIPLAEDRDALIERAAESSEGLSGRELRTVMRTALPRALVSNPEQPQVTWADFEGAIADIRNANRNVGKRAHIARSSDTEIDSSIKLLGISNPTTNRQG